MPMLEIVDDAEKGILDTLTPLPVLPVSSKAVIQDAAVGLAVQSGVSEKKMELAVAASKRDPSSRNKPKWKLSRWARFQLWFTTKFFTFVITLNGVGLLLAALNIWTYPRRYTGAFILGNLIFAILMRNEVFGRLLYWFVNACFAKWPPLWFRLCCFAWLIFRVVLIFIDHKDNHDAVLITGVITNIAVAISIVSAFPWVRNTHHNLFERHHRFIGWVGLVSTWIFVVLGDSYDLDTHSWNPDGVHVIRQQDFWYVFGMTVLILIPWFTVREVKVDIEVPSPKVAILRFERGMQQGLLSRISRSSIMEYHAFGIVSGADEIWVQFAGVSHTSTLYKRGIRVCTGTGLGAALSTCLQNPDWYLIWIGSDQEKTFGPTISGLIYRHLWPDRVLLWDSKARGGRPDVMKLIKDAYHSWGAEVVFITSNWQGNKELMEGCKAAGIPAFGTLWDF
ncbi:hypothetical protein BN946_scf184403.g19 [Trametes cinnabarina]|uniref:Non-ribosomal peptide synthetase n=1 Tax=Pycnoporus cinnabarinus TaxID=5643 RepID=A0A060SXR0_PYCCI|nr:hypothetical protein BN946_scf184403.g19 [Trametes cinnabarina]